MQTSSLLRESSNLSWEAIHVGGIIASEDERTDLVIIAGSKYSANQPLGNGVTHDFGLINFDCNTSAKLWLEFFDF